MNRIFFSMLALTASIAGHTELVTYPAGQGVATIEDFTVNVRQDGGRWSPVAV